MSRGYYEVHGSRRNEGKAPKERRGNKGKREKGKERKASQNIRD